jgi:hypothetical protein
METCELCHRTILATCIPGQRHERSEMKWLAVNSINFFFPV